MLLLACGVLLLSVRRQSGGRTMRVDDSGRAKRVWCTTTACVYICEMGSGRMGGRAGRGWKLSLLGELLCSGGR